MDTGRCPEMSRDNLTKVQQKNRVLTLFQT
jgi:hypothetical protein